MASQADRLRRVHTIRRETKCAGGNAGGGSSQVVWGETERDRGRVRREAKGETEGESGGEEGISLRAQHQVRSGEQSGRGSEHGGPHEGLMRPSWVCTFCPLGGWRVRRDGGPHVHTHLSAPYPLALICLGLLPQPPYPDASFNT